MNKQFDVQFSELKQIIHVADIHIRNLKRHKEYKEVFKRFFDTCKKIIEKTPETIIVVVGDLVHAKTDMSPELVSMTGYFLNSCADITTTILVPGNHDANLNNKSRLDALSPIVQLIKNPNLYYFKKNGIYTFADTDFAIYSVLDDDEFPKVENCKSKNKIALYHGTVNCAKTDLGFQIESKITVDQFNGYDIVCLGDIHYQQSLNEKGNIKFVGSLVQQNHGEGLTKGLLLWNVKERKSIPIEIPNDYGYYTLKLSEPTLPTDLKLPKHTQLRLQVPRGMLKSDVKTILSEIKTKFSITDVIVNTVSDKQNLITDRITGSDVIGNVYDVNYQNSLIKEFLTNSGTFVDDEELEIIYNLNRKLNEQLKQKELNNMVVWEPLYLKFSNMFSYGEDNFVDFTKISGVHGIFANNAAGKSSLISILLFMIGGKSLRTTRSVDVLNVNKKFFTCEFCFKIADKKYFILKQAKKVKTPAEKITVQVFVDFWTEDESGNKISLNDDQRRSTEDNIEDIVGTIDNLILTAVSLQNNFNGIIDKSQSERKSILSSFLGIDIFENIYTLGNEKSREINALIKEFSKKNYDEDLSKLNKQLQISKKQLDHSDNKIKTLDVSKNKINTQIIEFTKKLSNVDAVKNIKILNEELSQNKKDFIKNKNDIDSLNLRLQTVITSATDLADKFKSYNEEELDRGVKELEKLEIGLFGINDKQKGLSIEIKHQEEKLKKLDKLEYDPNCKFCMNNIFVKDAIETKKNYADNLIKLTELGKKIDLVNIEINKRKKIKDDKQVFLDIKQNKEKLKNLYNNLILEQATLIEKQKYIDKVREGIDKEIELYHKNEQAIKNNEHIKEKILHYQNKFKVAENELSSEVTENRTLLGNIKVYQTQKEEIIKIINRIQELEKENRLFDLYLNSIHRNSIPYELIKKVIPVFEDEINNILTQIVDFRILVDLDGSHIHLYIVYDDKNWLLELTSGMEKFISSLAIRIALMKISNIPKPNFLVVDEGWSALDSNNMNQLSILFEYLKDYFKFVLIISHLDQMRDLIDSVIELSIEKGYSKIWYN